VSDSRAKFSRSAGFAQAIYADTTISPTMVPQPFFRFLSSISLTQVTLSYCQSWRVKNTLEFVQGRRRLASTDDQRRQRGL